MTCERTETLTEHDWQRSTFSGGGGNNCVEVAKAGDQVVLRESDAPAQVIVVGRVGLRALLVGIRAETLQSPLL
ncbi:DUF397 domain-containing protein [Streptomyces abikoensis]|uniref:DUF397 domain-containing protein n=1 Tax=Streptomyces abikoensis TaxID=97398 RepID=UPI00340018F9